MQSNTPLRKHLEKLNSILLDLHSLDVKIDNEDVTLISLVSLPSSFGNFVDSFVVGKDSLTLEEVKATLHTRELHQKAISVNGDSGSELFVKFEKSKKKRGLTRAIMLGQVLKTTMRDLVKLLVRPIITVKNRVTLGLTVR